MRRLVRRFDGFAEETVTVQRLPGWFKQRSNRLYPVRPLCAARRHICQRNCIMWKYVVNEQGLPACRHR